MRSGGNLELTFWVSLHLVFLTMMLRFLRFTCLLGVAAAWSAPNKKSFSLPKVDAKAAAAAVAISVLLSTTEPAMATSKTAAQISLDSLPPATISVQIQDLPVVGNLLSGTYTKVDKIEGKPSIVIKSPADKLAAVQSIATGGHLEFDINGLINTHMDVDVGADEPGVAKVRVASNLIPKLPFKNAATMPESFSGKKTPWNVVTNMGTGSTYYYNEETGDSQFEKPQI
jgi:hypothetical protein